MVFFAASAANKGEGFALMEILGMVNLIPIADWFIPTTWQFLVDIRPLHWVSSTM